MAAPLRIDELTALGSLSSGAAVAVVQGGLTLQVPASAFITQAPSFTPSGSGISTDLQTWLRLSKIVFGWIPTALWTGIQAGTNTTDLTTYIQDAIDELETGTGVQRTIRFPSGTYDINGTLTMIRGTVLEGEGPTGSTIGYGTWIRHGVNNGIGLLWNGDDAFHGTGGALKNINICKKDGFTGGDAIKLLAISDSERPGEHLFDNVLVLGEGAATWARAWHVDGTACTTAGSKGVRNIYFRKCRAADTTQANQSVYLNQAVHVYGEIAVDTGDGSNAGITIAGDSTDYHLTVRTISFTINDSTTDEAATGTIRGEVSGAFDNNNEDLTGFAAITGCSGITNASKSFRIISEKADSFYATVDTTITNVTGDSTAYTIIFETEQYDNNASYNASTGVFTAKCAGTYHFSWAITMGGVTSAETRSDSGLLHTTGADATLNSVEHVLNPFAAAASGNFTERGSIILELAEGEKAKIIADVSGGTKVVDIVGSSASRYSYFCGKLVA